MFKIVCNSEYVDFMINRSGTDEGDGFNSSITNSEVAPFGCVSSFITFAINFVVEVVTDDCGFCSGLAVEFN